MNITALSTVPGEEEFSLFEFFENLWKFFYDVYLSVDGNYQNLGFDTGTITSVRIIVLGIFIGTVIGCLYMAYNKQVLGGAVRKMLAENGGCRSAENAKTLAELGLIKNPFIKSAVQRSASLRRVVRCVEEEEFYRAQAERKAEYEKKCAESEERLPKFRELEYCIDVNSDHFYIPEELCDMAEHKFESKGFSWVATIIGIVLLCIAFFIVLLVLPKVLTFVDEFLGTFKKSGY
jgi:hypothetical protein